jgi:hypothetical protein
MLCLLQVHEPVGVQALGSEGSVEAFNEGVVSRLARPPYSSRPGSTVLLLATPGRSPPRVTFPDGNQCGPRSLRTAQPFLLTSHRLNFCMRRIPSVTGYTAECPSSRDRRLKRRRLSHLQSVCLRQALADRWTRAIDFPETGWAGHERYEQWACRIRLHCDSDLCSIWLVVHRLSDASHEIR